MCTISLFTIRFCSQVNLKKIVFHKSHKKITMGGQLKIEHHRLQFKKTMLLFFSTHSFVTTTLNEEGSRLSLNLVTQRL